MIDIDALIADLQSYEELSDWNIRRAWTMTPVDDESLPSEVPILALYRGTEVFSPRTGSPCSQTAISSLIAVYVVRHAEDHARIKQARQALLGWQKAADRECLHLYLSDDAGMPCGPISITGSYVWQGL